MKTSNPLVRTAPLVLVVIAALLLQGQTIYFPMIFNNYPPLYSTSYYIQNADPAYLEGLGCNLGLRDASTPGRQDSIAILDFGKMWVFDSSTYGIRTFGNPNNGWTRQNLSFNQLKDRAKSYAQGYWNCSGGDNTSHITVGVGTNTFDFFNQTFRDQDNLRIIAADFGRNWAKMIEELNQWGAQTGYASQITFVGAIDIEWAGADPEDGQFYWQTPHVVEGWVDAFDEYDNKGNAVYFNYGACVGCPIVPDPNWVYATSLPWKQENIWKVSWGAQPAFSIPEIYRNDGYLAKQWAAVSKFGALYRGSRIIFSGAMTQMVACQQRGGTECNTLDNTPAEGWLQLVTAINAETFTAQPFLQYSTDIKWQFK